MSNTVTSSSHAYSQENISIETIEKPFLRNVTDITHSDDGTLFFGTSNNGLIEFNSNNESLKIYNTSNDFPLNEINYVNWKGNEETLFFSSCKPIPYPKNESIIPWVYAKNENFITPVGNRNRNYREVSYKSILINGDNIFIDGDMILLNYKKYINDYNMDLNIIYINHDSSTIYHTYGIYHSSKSQDMVNIGNKLYTFENIYRGNEIVNSFLWEVSIKDLFKGDNKTIDAENYLQITPKPNCFDHLSNESTLIIGTSYGILFINKENMIINEKKTITEDEGLESNNIKCLVSAHNIGILLASTDNGLSIINKTNNNIINLDQSDGLLSNKINCIDWNEDRSELYIGHDNGISILTIEDNTDRPKISHTPVTQATVGKPIPITATITDESDISSAHVYYRPTDQANFTSIEMEADGDDYKAEIPTTPTPGKMEYYIEASDIYGNENVTDVYEMDVVKEGVSMQDKDGYIPGTDMTSSVIITVIISLIAVLFVTFFYYSKEKRKN